MIAADVTSIVTIQATTAAGTRAARTSCGRNRPKYVSRAVAPNTATAATSALWVPSNAAGWSTSRRCAIPSRSCESTLVAASRPTASNPQARPARRANTKSTSASGPVRSARALPANDPAITRASRPAWASTSTAVASPIATSAASRRRTERARPTSRGSRGPVADRLSEMVLQRAECRTRGAQGPATRRPSRSTRPFVDRTGREAVDDEDVQHHADERCPRCREDHEEPQDRGGAGDDDPDVVPRQPPADRRRSRIECAAPQMMNTQPQNVRLL